MVNAYMDQYVKGSISTSFNSEQRRHHRAKHEGITYSCDLCEYKATLKSNLSSHNLIYHEGIRSNIYKICWVQYIRIKSSTLPSLASAEFNICKDSIISGCFSKNRCHAFWFWCIGKSKIDISNGSIPVLATWILVISVWAKYWLKCWNGW